VSSTTTFTVRIPAELRGRLDRLAAATARTRSWLAADALSSYVESQEWQVEQIRQGIRDANEGRVVGHDRVAEWLRSWGTKSEKRPPKCR
jgi:predicted transcriptional regulator